MCESRIKALPYPVGSITESKKQNQVVGIVCESRIRLSPLPLWVKVDTSRRLSGIRFYTEYFNNARILSRLWPLPTCGGASCRRVAPARRTARAYVARDSSVTPSSHAPHRNRFCHNDNRTIQLPPGPTRQLRAPQR